ncbi:Tetraspanin family [Musa troglodytarum]|uniref:Tetraspanin family n=1 Tax=Musa troglodytarum TaxID=320322 RepID=A0A9E7JPY3_9LILI|nr:Tetraspanin family [Musa troglodytarum]
MVKISNSLVGVLNFHTLLISFPVIGIALWLRIKSPTECELFLQLPLLVVGVFLFVVSVLGFVGSCFRDSIFLCLYLFLLFLLILAMAAFTVFAFVVTNKNIGQAISGKGYREYRLGDYSHWLQKRVGDRKNWRAIHGCLKEAKVCGRLEDDIGTKASEFYRKNLSPIQSGCCKPPTYCGFTYGSGLSSSNSDCKTWSNDQDKLCYGCNACKGGVLATLKNGWKKVVILNAALLAFVIVIYSVGCCAFRNNKSHSHHTHFYRGGYH